MSLFPQSQGKKVFTQQSDCIFAEVVLSIFFPMGLQLARCPVTDRSATGAIWGLTPTGITRVLSAIFFKLSADTDWFLWRNHTRCQGLAYQLGELETKYRFCCNQIMGELLILKDFKSLCLNLPL